MPSLQAGGGFAVGVLVQKFAPVQLGLVRQFQRSGGANERGEQLRTLTISGRHMQDTTTLIVGADRGRNDALICAAPPSEPYMRISRIRLSG